MRRRSTMSSDTPILRRELSDRLNSALDQRQRNLSNDNAKIFIFIGPFDGNSVESWTELYINWFTNKKCFSSFLGLGRCPSQSSRRCKCQGASEGLLEMVLKCTCHLLKIAQPRKYCMHIAQQPMPLDCSKYLSPSSTQYICCIDQVKECHLV